MKNMHTNFPMLCEAKDGHDFFVAATEVREGKTKYVALDKFYDNILMELSLLVGMLHLSCSLLRYVTRNWAAAGWVVFMIGGYLLFPEHSGCHLDAQLHGMDFKASGLLVGRTIGLWGHRAWHLSPLSSRKSGWPFTNSPTSSRFLPTSSRTCVFMPSALPE